MPEGARVTTLPRRGDATRERLLDAAETLVSERGFRDPSHRALAGEAGVHVALVNYHFGSKELLFEEALSRRASRLADAWREALAQVRAQPAFTAEEVLRAYWLPFEGIECAAEGSWRNYLCVVARLVEAERSGEMSEDEFISTAMLILMAGHGSTIDVLGSGMHALLRFPAEMQRLKSDPGLMPTAVQEMFRFESPLPFFDRYAAEDVEVAGAVYPRGTRFGLPRTQVRIAGLVTGGIEAFGEGALIPDDSRTDAVGKLIGLNHIAQSQRDRVHAEPLRGHVHQAFGHKCGRRPTDAAIRSGRRLGGRDAAHAP